MSSQRSEGLSSSSSEATPNTATVETTTSPLTFPDEFDMSGSWKRKAEHDSGGWVNDAERMVWLENSDEPRRVVFVLSGHVLRAECDCPAHHYDDWCAHVASCWWDWCNRGLAVTHLQTGREYDAPPSWLQVAEWGDAREYEGLSAGELDAYLTCELGECGVREYARKTERSPGTVGNQLRWAREKVGGEQA